VCLVYRVGRKMSIMEKRVERTRATVRMTSNMLACSDAIFGHGCWSPFCFGAQLDQDGTQIGREIDRSR
jgi:hypothetical protein